MYSREDVDEFLQVLESARGSCVGREDGWVRERGLCYDGMRQRAGPGLGRLKEGAAAVTEKQRPNPNQLGRSGRRAGDQRLEVTWYIKITITSAIDLDQR